jgi:transposase
MPALRKYDPETRERAVRLFRDRRRDRPSESVSRACRDIGELIDVNPDTLRGWINRDEIDRGDRPGVPTEINLRIKELERENAELRRANEILKTASAFFAAAELDRRLR